MARPDKVYASYRGIVSAVAIAGQFGAAAASEDLALVKRDGSGNLVVATQGDAEGIIWTPEGKASSSVASFLSAAAGAKMTVFTMAQFTDVEGDLGLTAGAVLWSTAAGDVVFAVPAAPIQKVGFVMLNDTGVDLRLVMNISLLD